MSTYNIRQQGDRCLTIDLGDHIDEQVGMRCLELAQRIRSARIDGILDVVPSFLSVTIHFEPRPSLGPNPSGLITDLLEKHAVELDRLVSEGGLILQTARNVVIPVCYEGTHAPDLEAVATSMGLTPTKLIEAHCSKPLRVYMLGFAPGQPYIGIHDESFAIPRKANPRTAVPAGSIGIANRQTTIYPNLLPGGWEIIGATPLKLFNPASDAPTLLCPGDEVIFEPISQARFEQILHEQKEQGLS